MRCKICAGQTSRKFGGTVLGKHQISYFECSECGFIQTEEPYWLEEAYSSAISDLDLGPVNRAIVGARVVEGVILTGFDPNARFLDWGGGYGVFTRLMRDLGYDFYWYDLYCENLFAKQFVAEVGRKYELVTAFEVFEHLVDPLSEIERMLGYSDSIAFTTLLIPGKLTSTKDWWYFAPELGQHVAFYSLRSLEAIAERYGLHLRTDGTGMHLLSKTPVSEVAFKIAARDRRGSKVVRRLLRRKLRKQSLLMEDFRAVTRWDV